MAELKKKVEPTEPMEATSTEGLLDKAVIVTEELKAANAKHEELLNREEKLSAFNALGGKSTVDEKKEPVEETAVEYKDRIMRGGK